MKTTKSILLIGLGRFGRHLAIKFHELNHEVLAIDKDESASIFDIADLGIIGDAKVILPLLIEEIRQHKA